MHAPPTTLLLVLPLPIFDVGGEFYLDAQACNGLRLWLDNFDRIILCNPVQSVAVAPADTLALRPTIASDRLSVELFPTAWTPPTFLRALRPMIGRLNRLIDRATHLQFAIGGFWGDWGAVGALVAHRKGRQAAIWTDRVESQVMAFQAQSHAGARRIYRLINAWLAKQLERIVIRRSALGLFHGMDTYSAYARYSPAPHLVHDIHLGRAARIGETALAIKLARGPRDPLKLVYAGRVHRDKGVYDWIEALALAIGQGAAIEAVWYGDGPELAAARALIAERGLGGAVEFAGALHDRERLLEELRRADLFLFCHLTLESPRCLIEALLSGTPIIGYRSDYAADLIAAHGGGILTAMEPGDLAARLVSLAGDPATLERLIAAAAADGHPMVDEDVFRHRSDLIKTLSPIARADGSSKR